MPNTWNQDNPLTLLDIELERTLRTNRTTVNEGIHNQEALIKGIHDEAAIFNHPAHQHDDQEIAKQITA